MFPFLTNYVTVSFHRAPSMNGFMICRQIIIFSFSSLLSGLHSNYHMADEILIRLFPTQCSALNHIPLKARRNGSADRHFYARSNCHMPQLRETDNGRDSVFSLHCHNLLRSFLYLSRMKDISRVPFRAPSSEIKWLLCDATRDSIAANKAGKVFTRTVIIWNFRNHLNRYGSRLAISSHHRIILRIPSSSSTVVGQCDKQ